MSESFLAAATMRHLDAVGAIELAVMRARSSVYGRGASKYNEETMASWKALYGGKPVTGLSRDGGREFLETFDTLMKELKILQRISIPGRAQNNSRQERWHRTLQEGTRAALVQSGLP